MAVLSLPLSFTNSFWSQDYRRGLEVLYAKLEQGVAENSEIIAFVRARAVAEKAIADSLSNPVLTGPAGRGFGADDGASLAMAFRGLQGEAVAQGQVHKSIASELTTLVADPFEQWAHSYKERLDQSKATVLDKWLLSYEYSQGEVSRLKSIYLGKTHRADEAEDDAKFAPNGDGVADKYTSSPRVRPVDGRQSPQRTPSVSERIANRLKEIQKKSAGRAAAAMAPPVPAVTTSEGEEADEHISALPKIDKGKGKQVMMESPPPINIGLPPAKLDTNASTLAPPILLAGLAFSPSSISALLKRAHAELPLRPVRFPLLGEYQDCFTGEEFVNWLCYNVQGYAGSLDLAEAAAKDLTEREGLLRRIGEFGNDFEVSDDAFYQFRPKAFDVQGKADVGTVNSPLGKSLQSPVADKLVKRTNTFVNLVSKALNNNSLPAYVKARNDAEEADQAYRVAIRKLDRQRLGLEEGIEDTLKTLQRWETERLRAVKTVLLQYQGTLANMPKTFVPSLDRSTTLISAFQPESDLNALMERYRTGPFRPDAQIYESVAHDEFDVLFGIDLRKWAEGDWNGLISPNENAPKQVIPSVLEALLSGLQAAYAKLPNDDEKRKSWIYDVPLPAVHHLREALNASPLGEPIPSELLAKYDAPVIAAVVKLWALELDPPLALYEGWDDFRKLYPTVGSTTLKTEGDNEEKRIRDVGTALQKLPRVHLYVLDAIVNHLKTLIESTSVEETNEVYITKLALAVGRTIIRPKFENELSVQDRHPTLLFIDLVTNYEAILPPTIARKKRESERKIPIRKRTAMVDQRLSRSRMSVGADPQQLLAAQNQAQGRSKQEPLLSPPPVLPTVEIEPPTPAKPAHSEPVVQETPLVAEPEEVAAPPTEPTAPSVPVVAPTPAPIIVSGEGRPTFKEPPAENDDTPTRPTFKEPPPEMDDLPPRPKFASPPPEEPESPLPVAQAPAAAPSPPPTKTLHRSSLSRSDSNSPRSGSPDANGTRPVSTTSAGVRGPRISRGPRAPGNVSSIAANLNRNSVGGAPRPSSPGSPSYKRLSNPTSRPTSVLNKSTAFSTRTMASDAEDDVVERK